MYDSVTQYGQALDGSYADWHPPIMARLWAALLPWWPGTAPLFLGQMLLWWGGFGLIAAALAGAGRRAAAGILLVGACPLFLGWGTAILKDAQMAACLLMAAGLCATPLVEDRPIPPARVIPAALLILYAALVRGNAVFAAVPLGIALLAPPRWSPWQRGGAAIAGIVVVIALSPPINHRLLGAEATHVEHTLPLYDMAGIAHHAGLPTLPGLPPERWAEAERRGCYTPFYWNPYGEERQCGAIGEALAFDDVQGPQIMRRWAGFAATHPIAYAAHRLDHLNANLRFWVAAGEPDAMPPTDPEPNDLDLGRRGRPAGRWVVRSAGAIVATPLGWPVVWLAVALALLWVARDLPGGRGRLGRALALSAATMGASFAVVSIASDLRYHLWTMMAAAAALVILIDAGVLRRPGSRGASVAVGVVVLLATIGRVAAPAVPVPTPPKAEPATPGR